MLLRGGSFIHSFIRSFIKQCCVHNLVLSPHRGTIKFTYLERKVCCIARQPLLLLFKISIWFLYFPFSGSAGSIISSWCPLISTPCLGPPVSIGLSPPPPLPDMQVGKGPRQPGILFRTGRHLSPLDVSCRDIQSQCRCLCSLGTAVQTLCS